MVAVQAHSPAGVCGTCLSECQPMLGAGDTDLIQTWPCHQVTLSSAEGNCVIRQ
jgi:hypothetical protein